MSRQIKNQDPVHLPPNALAKLNEAAEKADIVQAQHHFQQLLADPRTASTTVAWNTLLKAHANAGDLSGAERSFSEMQRRGIRINQKTYGKLVEAAAKAASPDDAERWLLAGKRIFGQEMVPYSTMIDACAKASDTNRALRWLTEMQQKQLKPSAVAYVALINAYAQAGDIRSARRQLLALEAADGTLDEAAYVALLTGCARAGRGDLAKEWLQEMKAKGMVPGIRCYSAALGAASEGDVAHWLAEMRENGIKVDAECYTILIHGCVRRGDLQNAERWMKEAISSGEADLQCYASMVNACARAGAMEAAERWLCAMEKEKLSPNEVMYASLISASCAQRAEELLHRTAQSQAVRMRDSQMVPNVVTYTAVLSSFAKKGHWQKAIACFDQMRQAHVTPNIISWNALLNSFVQSNHGCGATHCFQDMVRNHMAPNVVSFTSMIDCHSRQADPQAAEVWLKRMGLMQLPPTAVTFTALLKGYSKTGQVDEAAKVLQRMASTSLPLDVVSWTSLLGACAVSQRWDVALCALRWMKQLHVVPNQITHQALRRLKLR